MSLFSLVAIILATWRLALLISCEEGPKGCFQRLRELFGIKHDEDGVIVMIPDKCFAKMISCIPCLSIWIAGLVYLVWHYEPIPVWILAGSGGATLLEKVR